MEDKIIKNPSGRLFTGSPEFSVCGPRTLFGTAPSAGVFGLSPLAFEIMVPLTEIRLKSPQKEVTTGELPQDQKKAAA